MNIILQNAKAIVAFLTSYALLYMSPLGITAGTSVETALNIFFYAVITGVFTWLVPNKKV